MENPAKWVKHKLLNELNDISIETKKAKNRHDGCHKQNKQNLDVSNSTQKECGNDQRIVDRKEKKTSKKGRLKIKSEIKECRTKTNNETIDRSARSTFTKRTLDKNSNGVKEVRNSKPFKVILIVQTRSMKANGKQTKATMDQNELDQLSQIDLLTYKEITDGDKVDDESTDSRPDNDGLTSR